MPSELRIALAGCGRLGEIGYVPALRRAAGVRLAAVADPDATRRGGLAPDVPGYASLTELLEGQRVDGVVLATPAAGHLEDARQTAAWGLPALVEKPPAPDGASAAALARLEPAPWLGFNRRFHPGVAAIRSRLAGADGSLEIDAQLRYRRRAWAPYAVGDDALLDLGPHLVDLVRWVSGREVLDVQAPEVAPARAEMVLRLDRGLARLRLANDRPYREAVVARGPPAVPGRAGRAWVELRHQASRDSPHPAGGDGAHRRGAVIARTRSGGALAAARTLASRASGPDGGEHPLVVSLTRQLEAFSRAVRGGDPGPLAPAGDGAAVMAVIDAARASARAGGNRVVPARPAGAPAVA